MPSIRDFKDNDAILDAGQYAVGGAAMAARIYDAAKLHV